MVQADWLLPLSLSEFHHPNKISAETNDPSSTFERENVQQNDKNCLENIEHFSKQPESEDKRIFRDYFFFFWVF